MNVSQDLVDLFEAVAGENARYGSNAELEAAFATALKARRDSFPRAYSHRDAIDAARATGWISVEGDAFVIRVPAVAVH